MQQMMFHPSAKSAGEDAVSRTLLRISHYLLVLCIGLIPILFIPTTLVSFSFSKIMIVVAAMSLSLIFYVLAALRDGQINLMLAPGLLALWGVTLVALLAAVFSGDFADSFSGTNFGTGTAAFVILLAVVATLTTSLRSSKRAVMRLYILIAISAIILLLYHTLRVFVGPEVLSFGLFTSVVDSPLGAWNDIALFGGLVIILSVIALEQLPLTKWGQILLSALAVITLGMLALVNFFSIWVVLAAVSLVILMYSLTKQRFRGTAAAASESGTVAPVILSIVIFVVSVAFLIGGGAIGNWVASSLGISYVQVTPSLSATVDIARSVYSDNPLLGVGPNKFVDAWRLYKDPSINQTIFWSTPFESGNGYLTTSFVTMGLVGVVAWLGFLALLVYTGVRMLFTSALSDRFWYFVATSSFVAALYLWGMTFVYVPSVTMLLLAAVCTGLVYGTSSILLPTRSLTLSMSNDRRMGLVLVAIVMVLIVGSVSALYFTGRQYVAIFSFNQALASADADTSLDTIEQGVAGAYQMTGNDIFARQVALYQLARLNALLTLSDPNQEQVAAFQTAMVNGVNYSQSAIQTDPTEPLNYQVLGQIYSLLVPAKVDGAYDRGMEAYENARRYDPHNPAILLLEAQLEARANKTEAAQAKAEAAIAMKRDYADALLFLTDIDISQNNIEQAIARTQSVITLEPDNPARYYQLGVLEAALDKTDESIAAFKRAIALDSNHANARYFLALQLVKQDKTDEALQNLRVVAELNPDNTELAALISSLETTGKLLDSTTEAAVLEPEAVQSEDGQVTTTQDPNTPLITPVNQVPNNSAEAADEE